MKLVVRQVPYWLSNKVGYTLYGLGLTWNGSEFNFDYKDIGSYLKIKNGQLYSIAEKSGCRKVGDMLCSRDIKCVELLLDELSGWELLKQMDEMAKIVENK